MRTFRDVAQRVRTHLCYAHVFQDALTRAEFVAHCCPDGPDEVEHELSRLEEDGFVERVGDHFFPRGYGVSDFASVKQERQDLARRIVDENRNVLRLLERLSCVKLLAISGSVAQDNSVSSPDHPVDLDIFMITAPSSLHIIILLLRGREIVLRFLVSLRLVTKRTRLCFNYLTESSFMEITNKSFYTATDALRVKTLKGDDEYQRFLVANEWMERFYPLHLSATVSDDDHETAPLVRRIANAACFIALGSASWVKSFLLRRPYCYSVLFRYDRSTSYRRRAQSGGGYQPQIAKRFSEIYRRFFEHDQELFEFLFPETTDTGVYHSGTHAASSSESLGYDE